MIKLHFDGACEFNPDNGKRNPGGIATYGWILQGVARGYGMVKRGEGATNNVAEYTALIEGVQAAIALKISILDIWGDSQLVVNQINGSYRVNSETIKPYYSQALEVLAQLEHYTIHWHGRDNNQEADDLSKAAYELSKKVYQPWQKRFVSKDYVYAPA